MNQKELNEIRRRIKPERNSINHIYGCYVNSQREVISYIDESVGLLSREEVEELADLSFGSCVAAMTTANRISAFQENSAAMPLMSKTVDPE